MPQKNSRWEEFFGSRLGSIFYANFDEETIALGPPDKREVEEYCFEREISAKQAHREFEKMGKEPASLWAAGRYFQTNKTSVGVGIAVTGALYQDLPNHEGCTMYPMFIIGEDGKFSVGMQYYDIPHTNHVHLFFPPNTIFLVYR